jgi:PAS domain S-box-containing protein
MIDGAASGSSRVDARDKPGHDEKSWRSSPTRGRLTGQPCLGEREPPLQSSRAWQGRANFKFGTRAPILGAVTLRRKILIAYVAVLVLVGAITFAGFALADRTTGALDKLERAQQTLLATARLRGALAEVETGQRGYLLTGRDVYLQPYNEAHAAIAAQIAQLEASVRSPANRDAIAEVKRLAREKLDELTATIRIRREQGSDASLDIVNSDHGRETMEKIRAQLDGIEARTVQRHDTAELAVADARSTFAASAIVAMGLLVLVGSALTLLLSRTVTRRLAQLAEAARAFGFGDRAQRAGIEGHDEIASAGHAFDRMADLVERQETELEAHRQRISAVLDTVAEGVLVIDLAGAIHEVNPAAEALFGHEADALRGKLLASFFPRAPFNVEQIAAQPVRDQRFIESSIDAQDGERPVEIAISRVDRPGEPLFVCVLRDIGERKRVEKLKSEFVSTVSHELRTPLTSIAGSLDLIAAGATGPVPAQAATLVEIARKNSRRLVRLINDILDVEKIDSGQLVLDFRRIDLREVTEGAIETTAAFAREHGVEYRLVADGEFLVYGDTDRLTQVLTNLLSNAAKFSPAGEAVEVELTRDGNEVRVEVRDRGPGIPAAFRDRIFQRFAQADGSDTRGKGGTGLGLAISKSLIERHGGRIGFDTESGQGTRFWFALPALDPIGALLPHVESRPGTPILVVEDDEDVATLLRLILEQAGYQVERAADLRQARLALMSRRYAAMTLDLMLPDGNAVELVRELRGRPATADLKIVVVSAVMAEGRRELNGDAVGVVDWIPKPIDPARLLEAVRLAVVGTSRPRILHVEDDPDVARVMQMLLRDVGDVIAAPDLASGRAAMEAARFDLLLLDIELPDGSGLELLPLARAAQDQPVPVIVFSADQVGEETARAVAATLVKSRVSSDELAKTIQRIVRSAP